MSIAEVHTERRGFIGKFKYSTDGLKIIEGLDGYEVPEKVKEAFANSNNHKFDGTVRFSIGEAKYIIMKY